MATRSSGARSMVSDYANIRSIPAILSVAFIAASLYQFGGISAIELMWLGGANGSYTLSTQHSLLVSLGAFVVAFASSETKSFEHYELQEQVLIALGPALILGNEYVTVVSDLLTNIGDPLGMQLAFVATIVSWAVAVQ
ncbi:hypothetical protein [Halorussus halobius]|uniref:hypothetical protein n=1 Tax=Halorussus halobius TaxID=1710537 RepID=UPI001092C895|nr:hypothetical protein [Halorussus halobius]